MSSHSSFPAPFSPWQPLIYFLYLWICLFWTFPINGNVQYMAFCFWLLFSKMFLRFIHVVAYIGTFLWPNNIPLSEHTISYLSIHQSKVISVVFTFWLLNIMLMWISFKVSSPSFHFSTQNFHFPISKSRARRALEQSNDRNSYWGVGDWGTKCILKEERYDMEAT